MIKREKYILSILIDLIVILIFGTFITQFINIILPTKIVDFYVELIFFNVYLILFSVKDITFRNSSFGKKTIGLNIIKQNGKKLKKGYIVIRNILVYILNIFIPLDIVFIIIFNRTLIDLILKLEIGSEY